MVGNSNSSTAASKAVWLAFDDAWDFESAGRFRPPPRVDALAAGPSLRFITTARAVESFYTNFSAHFRPFILSGSGDFHHLTAIFVRQIKEPFAILSFDNHPDWDIRPPHWACGAWVNRALENPMIEQVAVWGCGSFECHFPWRLLGNRSACRADRLWVAPWQSEGKNFPSWLHPVSSANWRAAFAQFVDSIRTPALYVTVDLDSLVASDAVTNWENGRFTVPDLVWAIGLLRQKVRIVGGDLCGAFSPMRYGSRFQALAGRFDHPRPRSVSEEERRSINLRVLETIWPHLTGESQER
jgi:hypothetical protein